MLRNQLGGLAFDQWDPHPVQLAYADNPPAGCRFHTRCPEAIERCKTEEPLLRETSASHWTSCLLVN